MFIAKGMAVAVGISSDYYPYAMVEVSSDYKTIKIQRDTRKKASVFIYQSALEKNILMHNFKETKWKRKNTKYRNCK